MGLSLRAVRAQIARTAPGREMKGVVRSRGCRMLYQGCRFILLTILENLHKVHMAICI